MSDVTLPGLGDPEFVRMTDATRFDGKPITIVADETERAALTTRFGLIAINELEAEVVLNPDQNAVVAKGTLRADIVQTCAISGDDLPVKIIEPLTLRFVPETAAPTEEEIELTEEELDEIPFNGRHFDLGEAVAQSLALAIDPYAVGPNAEEARKNGPLGDSEPSGPFAALAKLKN